MASFVYDKRRGISDRREQRRFARYTAKYHALPDAAREIFWAQVRILATEEGESPDKNWRDANILARFGLLPVIDETILVLKRDGSGSYTRRIYVEKWLEARVTVNGKPDPEETQEDRKEFVNALDAMCRPKDTSRVKITRNDADTKTLEFVIAFPSIDALEQSLASTEEIFKHPFQSQNGPEGLLFLRRSLIWPKMTDGLGIEFMTLDGLRERIVLRSETPIRRSTAMSMPSRHEAIWEGCVWDFLTEISVAAEICAAELPIRPPPARVDLLLHPQRKVAVEEAHDEGARYKLLSLKSNLVEDRRYAAADLLQTRNAYDLETQKAERIARLKDIGPALLQALETEDDFTALVITHSALQAWYGVDIPYWNVDEWRKRVEEGPVEKKEAKSSSPERK